MMTAAQITADLSRYIKGMMAPNGWAVCLAIEEQYGLDGYPPEIVSQEMNRLLRAAERRENRAAGATK